MSDNSSDSISKQRGLDRIDEDKHEYKSSVGGQTLLS